MRESKTTKRNGQHYVVSWAIDIYTNEGPAEAARQALEIQRDQESEATAFSVRVVEGGTVWEFSEMCQQPKCPTHSVGHVKGKAPKR